MEFLIVDDDGIGFDNRKIGTREEYLEIVIIKNTLELEFEGKCIKLYIEKLE